MKNKKLHLAERSGTNSFDVDWEYVRQFGGIDSVIAKVKLDEFFCLGVLKGHNNLLVKIDGLFTRHRFSRCDTDEVVFNEVFG